MKVGVTGGQGFIGTYIKEELLRKGHEVVIFDRHNHLDPFEDGVQFFQGDVRDATAITELAAHVDGLIHLAAVLGTQETITNPRPAAETNILGSLNVFEAANQYDLPVVYAGVGNHWMRTHGTGAYTISKTAAEDFTRMFNKYRAGRISVVRPVNAYGPRQVPAAPYGPSRVRKIIPSFVCRAIAGSPIEIYGDGTQVSDCVYVGDVARVFVGALEHTSEHDPLETPIGVGPAMSVTVNDVAQLVSGVVAVRTGHAPVKFKHVPMRPGEVPNSVVNADIDTLSQLPPEYHADTFLDLESGVTKTVDYFLSEWWPGYDSSHTSSDMVRY